MQRTFFRQEVKDQHNKQSPIICSVFMYALRAGLSVLLINLLWRNRVFETPQCTFFGAVPNVLGVTFIAF